MEKIVESAKLQNQTDQKLPDKDYDELKEEGIKEIDLEEETIDQPKKYVDAKYTNLSSIYTVFIVIYRNCIYVFIIIINTYI